MTVGASAMSEHNRVARRLTGAVKCPAHWRFAGMIGERFWSRLAHGVRARDRFPGYGAWKL
jgi:hypothetical protein